MEQTWPRLALCQIILNIRKISNEVWLTKPKSYLQNSWFFRSKLLTRLTLGLSHLNKHRFNHNFDSCINPLCVCNLEVESPKHFFLHSHHYTNIRKTLLKNVEMIDESILYVNDDDLIEILLFGNCKFSLETNLAIIKASINYIKNSDRFDKSLFWTKTYLFAP